MQGGHYKPSWQRDTEVFVVSALILYLQLVLIRWIGTEIRIFAYLGNLILVACFFGTGLGCYRSALPVSLTRLGIYLLLLTGLVANPLHLESLNLRNLIDWLAGFEDSPMWGMFIAPQQSRVVVALGVVGGLLYLIIFMFVPIGQVLGRALSEHPHTIQAYSVNIIGSLSGIWLFAVMSWCRATPVEWFGLLAILAIVLAYVTGHRNWWFVVALGIIVCFVWIGQSSGVRTIWSPYQKLEVRHPVLADSPKQEALDGAIYTIAANGTGYQLILNLADDFLRTHPRLYDLDQARLSHYNLAFQFKPSIHRLLILGAGAGNNAAAALRHGVEEIDCVEVDPEIYALGKELHPERPYDSPRVHMHVTDARAFLKSATGSYDMIWFALLDAQPGSSYNNRQLDHYMYTLQSFKEAQRLLTQDGILLVNFASRRKWISERLYGILQQVFDRPPMSFLLEFNGASEYGPPGELTLVTGNGAPT